MELKITEMKPEDAAEAAVLEREIFSRPWKKKDFLDALASPDTLYLVARDQERLAGYCGLWQSFDEADITNVAVTAGYRRRGVGRCMLKELMACGRLRGIRRYTLEVRAGNSPALHLYQTLGFEPAGIRRSFYELPTEDAVIMWTP